jgi:bifunctional non-homologous end joining protein LigD
MLATAGKPPPKFADFAIEAKYDGQRGIAVLGGGVVTLLSRNGANITRTFPEITAALPAAVGHRPVILDGEIVAPDATGVPYFGRLQQRWPQNRRPTAALRRECPAEFFVFDLLQIDGRPVTRQPSVARRLILDELRGDGGNPTIRFTKGWPECDAGVVLAVAAEMGLEGMVSKPLDFVYRPGERSPDWIKTPSLGVMRTLSAICPAEHGREVARGYATTCHARPWI